MPKQRYKILLSIIKHDSRNMPLYSIFLCCGYYNEHTLGIDRRYEDLESL